MSSSKPTAASNSSIHPEASSSAINKGKGKQGSVDSSHSDACASPTSASSIWVLTFDATEWAHGATTGVKLPIPPTYESFRYVNTDVGASVIHPPDVQSTGLIGVYASVVAAKTSGSSWLWQQLKDALRDDAAADRVIPHEKGLASAPAGWKRSGWVPIADGSCLRYSITDVRRRLALRVMVTESMVDCKSVRLEEYVTDVGSDDEEKVKEKEKGKAKGKRKAKGKGKRKGKKED